MMVGSLNPTTVEKSGDEQSVAGLVAFKRKSAVVPESGAVVLLLPQIPKVISRQSPDTIRPQSFEPLENPTIDYVRSQGGSVVRTNADGRFEIFARPGSYFLIVISKNVAAEEDQKLSREQVAGLSQYFIPVEGLIRKQRFYWELVEVGDSPVRRDDIQF